MVRGYRRNAAPIIDARVDQLPIPGGQIRRRLDVHARPENQPRHGDGPFELARLRIRRLRHERAGLGAEVLHDDLLQMPVAQVQLAQCQERVDPFFARFTDADEDAGRERHRQLARQPQRFQSGGGLLVRRAKMRPAAFAETPRVAFQHQALRGRHAAQCGDVLARHGARIGVRQQAGLPEHPFAHLHEVGHRGGVAELLQLVCCLAVTQLRLVTQREQRLLAARALAGARYVEHLIGGKIGALALARRAREAAVMAHVAAEARERDKNLARIGDDAAVAVVAQLSRARHELLERSPRDPQPLLFVIHFQTPSKTSTQSSSTSGCR